MFSLIQLQADTIANAASNVVIEKIAPNAEISVLEFILKGGFFLIPISILLFYTFYLIIEMEPFSRRAPVSLSNRKFVHSVFFSQFLLLLSE